MELIAGGEERGVNLGNWRDYLSLLQMCRLNESAVMLNTFREGLGAVLPIQLLPLFTSSEMEVVICGNSTVNVDLLKRCTEYDGMDPSSDTVKYFWNIIDEFTNEERTAFLRFVWARSRLPTSVQDFDMNFRLQGPQGKAKDGDRDSHLPHAQTCFFSLSLPHYSSQEVMRQKLQYAIKECINMDADVLLHNADEYA